MRGITLNKEDIQEYQQNRDPYLLIDFAEEVIPGVSAKGYKKFSKDHWIFKCHWPNNPNVSGMLQIEALVQMCALSILTLPGNKGKFAYLASANNLKWSRKIVPDDRLDIETGVISWKRGIAKCNGIGKVNGEFACKADFTLVVPDIMNQFLKGV